jgi:hypothetical protein
VTGLTPGLRYLFKVEARNVINYSVFSTAVTILAAQVPDAPTDLADRPSITLANQIGLKWVAPTFNGGSSLIDYRIWFDDAQGGEADQLLVTGLTSVQYTATGLVQGSTYTFKV